MRHARRAADHHHALDFRNAQSRIAQRLAGRAERFRHELPGHVLEFLLPHAHIHGLAARESLRDARLGMRREELLGNARPHEQEPRVLDGKRREFCLLHDPAEQALVEIVAAERGVAVGRHHFEHALRELEDRDVESAAAEIVYGVNALCRVVQSIGDRCGGRLVQQPQHVQTRELARILGGLTLRLVEVGRDRDDGASELTP